MIYNGYEITILKNDDTIDENCCYITKCRRCIKKDFYLILHDKPDKKYYYLTVKERMDIDRIDSYNKIIYIARIIK